MARLVDWAWERYDYLSDPQRVLLGFVVALVLATMALYLLGTASLLALQRLPEPALAAAPAAPPVAVPELGVPDVDPISPLLADVTPTPRPTFTPRPTSTAAPTATATASPTARPSATPARVAAPTGPRAAPAGAPSGPAQVAPASDRATATPTRAIPTPTLIPGQNRAVR